MKAKIVTLFNHKGGVSKTTTTYNLAWKLARNGKKVLCVDGDPQCNLTGLFLGDDFYSYYENENTKLNNIKDAVKVAFEGKPEPIKPIECYNPKNNSNIYLIPGHMDLSAYDSNLSLALNSGAALYTLQNLPGAFYQLIKLCAEKYDADYVLIDMNPGLSAINQVLFMIADGFIVPTNPDPFSVMAIRTLKLVLPRWKKCASVLRNTFSDSAYPLPNSDMKFLGMVIQRFNLRKGKAAKPYQNVIDDIKNSVKEELVPCLAAQEMVADFDKLHEINDYCLAEISDFGSLLQKANEVNKPIFDLSNPELEASGVVLEQMSTSRQRFDEIFTKIANCMEILIQ